MVNLRRGVPDDHPLSRSFSETDVRRVKSELDSIFDFSENNLEREDVSVSDGPKGAATVEPDGQLSEGEFDTFTDKAKSSEKLGFDRLSKQNFAIESELDTPRPLEVHQNRGEETATTDVERKARVTLDPEQYAKNPGSFDYPFVDTPAEFRDRFGDDPSPMRKFDEMAGDDGIFEW